MAVLYRYRWWISIEISGGFGFGIGGGIHRNTQLQVNIPRANLVSPPVKPGDYPTYLYDKLPLHWLWSAWRTFLTLPRLHARFLFDGT